ncbi:uncharacterized protein LOC130641969 [Hydractinia symbiolongicarpus]|uniref:uncharacterized protein LOC130641969 n=1 Tax=Hydractinia symbiolongicarpus TaxID=13093 RepID=UPI002550FD2A|nr:uncharacterized protein LOC130641969 [Hydractinia symbiolongicarpus]
MWDIPNMQDNDDEDDIPIGNLFARRMLSRPTTTRSYRNPKSSNNSVTDYADQDLSSEINAIIGGAPVIETKSSCKGSCQKGCDCRKIGVKCTVGFCLCDPCKCKNINFQVTIKLFTLLPILVKVRIHLKTKLQRTYII